jgi:hypothetical protein
MSTSVSTPAGPRTGRTGPAQFLAGAVSPSRQTSSPTREGDHDAGEQDGGDIGDAAHVAEVDALDEQAVASDRAAATTGTVVDLTRGNAVRTSASVLIGVPG